MKRRKGFLLLFSCLWMMTTALFAQQVSSVDALMPEAAVEVVTRCKLVCEPENEAYCLSQIRSLALRSRVAELYAKQFPTEEHDTRHTDWASRLAMPGVVTFDTTTKVVTFTVAAESFEVAQQLNHTYVALCQKTLEENSRAYMERATKAITASIRMEIEQENARLQRLLDAPSSTRVKLQREDSIQRLKSLNQQLHYAEETVKKQRSRLELLSNEGV
jgi:hypothetical protein